LSFVIRYTSVRAGPTVVFSQRRKTGN